MELVYASDKVKTQCTSVKAARKLFGGDNALTVSLHARINALREADTRYNKRHYSSASISFS